MLFCQLDYPQTLGTKDPNAPTVTIAEDGCALCALASVLANVFEKNIDPHILNGMLIDAKGFASNGAGDYDLIDWTAIDRIFPDILVNANTHYYNPPAGNSIPADMGFIDNELSNGYSVIVGVSFNHNPKEPTPTHYVEIYRKNQDNTYQMRDSMFRGAECDTVFDTRYAVNGLNVAESILQVITYIYADGITPVARNNQPAPTISIDEFEPIIGREYLESELPAEAFNVTTGATLRFSTLDYTVHVNENGTRSFTLVTPPTVQAVQEAPVEPLQPEPTIPGTIVDNPAMVLTGDLPMQDKAAAQAEITPDTEVPVEDANPVDQTDLLQKHQDLQKKYKTDLENYIGILALGFEKAEDVLRAIEEVSNENTGLKKQLVQVLRRNKNYHLDIAAKEEEDATAIETGMGFEQKYKDLSGDMSAIARVFKTKPSMTAILSAADNIKSAYNRVVQQLKKKQIKDAAETMKQVETQIQLPVPQSGLTLLNKFLLGNFKKGE